MAPEVGIAPTSPPLQGGANLPQLLGVRLRAMRYDAMQWLAKPLLQRRLVVPAGNAPASSGYQPGALLLSYRTMAEGVGNALTSAMPILFSRQVQPAYICLPSKEWSGWQEMHLGGRAQAPSWFQTRPSAADITP